MIREINLDTKSWCKARFLCIDERTEELQDAIEKVDNTSGMFVQHHFSQGLVLVETVVILDARLEFDKSVMQR